MSETTSPVGIPSGGSDPYADLVSGKVSGSGFPGQAVQFPNNVPPGAAPKISTGADPYNDMIMGRGAQTVQFPQSGGQKLSPALMADVKTLQQFMAGQRNGANINPQTVGQPSAPTPMGGGGGAAPRVPGAAGGAMPGMEGLSSLPKPQQAVVMGALGRLLTAASARLGGGVAGAAAAPTAANAQEPAALAKMGLGTGADRVKMPDWDKEAKPFGVAGKPPPAADAKPPVKSAEPVVAPVPKKAEDKPASEKMNPTGFDTKKASGMLTPGNVDPWNRKVLHNPDGGYSTTSSMSIGVEGKEVLIPTVVDGKRLSKSEAIAHFRKTGENLGTFDNPKNADTYATALHNAQAEAYDSKGNPKGAATPSAADKPSAKPNFERAFAAAVKDPAKPKVFEWNGKKYKVELAQDVKRKGIGALVKNDDGEADKLNAKELARVRGA